MFRNRHDAGRQLAEVLRAYEGSAGTVVLGIPRGGVIVAAEVARALGVPLDVAVAAKVGAPGNPEYAVGAVAADGEVTANPGAGYSAEEVRAISGAAHAKVETQLAKVRGDRPPLQLAGKTAILVDDGLATGLTATAAADWLRRKDVARVIVAVPVAPPDTVRAMSAHADEVVVVEVPRMFSAVGQFYREFGQTDDAEVRAALDDAGGTAPDDAG